MLLIIAALQFSAIQTFATKRIARYLSQELEADISLDRIYLKPFTALELINFKWKDKNGKTIIAVESLESNFSFAEIFHNKLEINEIIIDKGYINLEIYKDSTNFTPIINYFNPKKVKKDKKNNNLTLELNRVELKQNELKIVDHTEKHHNKGVDFSDLAISEFSAIFDDIRIDSIMQANISNFSLKEKSGLIIRKLETEATYARKFMEFRNLYLATNKSILQDYLKFEYDSIQCFGNFIKEVNVQANIRASKISSKDIEYFAPPLKTVVFETAIQKAKLSGTVANIVAKDVLLKTAKQTELAAAFTIKGLPKINSTVFNFNIKKLKTSAADVDYLVAQLSDQKTFRLPSQLSSLGHVIFNGSFVGLYNDFNVNGNFNTALGNLVTTSKISIKKPLTYVGNISSNKFAIGTLIENNTISSTALNLKFDGSGLNIDDLALKIDGYINNTDFQNYTYEKLILKGNLDKKIFDLKGQVIDRNLDLDFASKIDWQQEKPTYLLNAKVNHASLNKLHWINKDSIVLNSATISTNLVGQSLNTIVGHLYADSIKMSTTKGDFEINSIDFNADGNEKNRSLSLQSDVVDAQINGNIDLNTIIPYFKSLAMRYAPASAIATTSYNSQNFNLDLTIKSFKPIAALIDPNLMLDDGAYLNADFSSDNYTAKFIAYSPTVTYKGMKLTNLSIEEMADDKAFSLDIMADRLNFSDSTYINKISINNKLANDSLHFTIEMSEEAATNYLNLNGNIHFAHNAPAYIKFQPSSILINREQWRLNEDASLRISKGKVYINNLLLNQGQQQVKFDGIISNENDQLNVLFDKFSLTSLNGFTNPLGINLKGLLTGNVQLNSLLKNPFASAKINTTPILYNEIPIGKLGLNANYDPSTGIAEIDLNLLDDIKRGISLNGNYNFFDKNEPLNIKGKLNNVDLAIFQPFLRNLVSNLKGRSDADISINGSLNNPKISGLGRFFKSEFTVNYLNTLYKLDNQIALVENNSIILQNFAINDIRGRQAKANGIINLSKVANPYIDIDTYADNLMILNTNFKDNNLYYGTAYATGNFKFKGFTSSIAIDIDAKSESGTVINIPFNSAMKVADSDFIYFISKDSTENKKRERRAFFNGLTMNMDFNLTQDAEVNIQTNLGSLKGNGKGAITMKISSLGDFEMFGDYVINNGKFHFTAQDFINKYFDIKEGGTVRWTGNPSDAIININALYQQRTAIRPLYNAAGRDGEDERVLAQADMLIKGTLEQPDISFDLNFPQNPYIKDQLQSYLSDANNVNQQALSLIVRRSFTPSSTDQIGKEVNNTLLSAGAEIAFNQLNNIISQSLNVNFFDLNIRSFNDASASVRLWDDRLVLTGGIADRTNFQATDLTFFRQGITTDAELTYRLRKDGSLMMRAYNRPYTRNFLLRSSDSDYISALGLVYRQEFNSLHEFWRRMWTWGPLNNEKKPKEKKKQ